MRDIIWAAVFAPGDPGWAGRWLVLHDHCLLLGSRLDGIARPTRVLLPCTAPHVVSGVEICGASLAVRPVEIVWQGGSRGASVELSSPAGALVLGFELSATDVVRRLNHQTT